MQISEKIAAQLGTGESYKLYNWIFSITKKKYKLYHRQ